MYNNIRKILQFRRNFAGLFYLQTHDENSDQDQKLRGLISSGINAAAQMGQNSMAQAPDSSLEQRQAANQQAVQQAAARQQQQQQAAGSLLGKLISTFIPGGGLLGFLKR